MTNKTKGWYAITVIVCSVLLVLPLKLHDIKGMRGNLISNDTAGSETEMWSKNEDVELASKEFLRSLNNSDYNGFKNMVSPSGLSIIKNYTYSDGVRGRDLRGYYAPGEIPKDMCFSVMNGFSISLKELFNGILDMDVSSMKHIDTDKLTFNFTTDDKKKTLPSTEEIWGICESIRAAENSGDSTMIYNLSEKEFVLTSSDDNTCRGGWAVFEKINNKYYLRAILDLR